MDISPLNIDMISHKFSKNMKNIQRHAHKITF